MKRALLLFTIVLSGASAYSQQAVLKFKTGDIKEVSITGASTRSLFTNIGTFDYVDIEEAEFSKPYNFAEKRLLAHGVKVTSGGILREMIVMPVERPAVLLTPQEAELDHLYTSLDKFRVQRTVGKAFQLVGVLAIGANLLLSQQQKLKPDEIKAIAIGGSAMSAIGFVIDFDAARHLRLKISK